MKQTAAEFDDLLKSPRGFKDAFSEYLTEVAYIIVTELLKPEDVNAVRAFEDRTPELLDAGVVHVLEHWESQSASREGEVDDHTLFLMHRHDVVQEILEDLNINTAQQVMALLDPLIEETRELLEHHDDIEDYNGIEDREDDEDDEDDLNSPLVPPLS
jgi:hypothetical protein